ncbi:MAG: hypothetical protein D4R43_02530 [Sphingobacteriales bacterium]|nr:MAG: hypothetical protein D4R43_02530 [Sphingobacteriales bacterium]
MNLKNTLLTLSAFVFILSSCKKDPITSANDESQKYFPLQVGRYLIYTIDSIHFNDVTMTSDTIHFQLKEEVGSSFIDITGDTTYILIRSRRMSDTLSWHETDQWSATVNKSHAEKTEENLRFVKMIFPIGDGIKWNGNQYIDTANGLANYTGWEYKYSELYTGKILNGLGFDSTVTVTELDIENLIEKDFEQEVYAKNYGLIYRIQQHVSKQNVSTPWTNPEKGTIVIYTVKEVH